MATTRLRQFFLAFVKNMARDERRRLKHFSVSAVTFFVGYGMIYWINKTMPPSAEQELWALAMVVLCAASFLYALLLQLIYIGSKILR